MVNESDSYANVKGRWKDRMWGLVTRMTEDRMLVWNGRYCTIPAQEFAFPRYSAYYLQNDYEFKPGSVVSFLANKPRDQLQTDLDIDLCRDQRILSKFTILPAPKTPIGYKVFTNMIFPPANINHYQNTIPEKVHAIAHSYELGKVAMLTDEKLDYESDEIYQGFVYRLDPNLDHVFAEKIGTLFAIYPGDELDRVRDIKTLETIRKSLPWKSHSSGSASAVGERSSGIKVEQPKQKRCFNPTTIDLWKCTPTPIHNNMNDDCWSDSDFVVMDPRTQTSEQQRRVHFAVQRPNDIPMGTNCQRHSTVTVASNQGVIEGVSTLRHPNKSVASSNVANEFPFPNEDALFGFLVTRKLNWIGSKNQGAATILQKRILELCNNAKTALLERRDAILHDAIAQNSASSPQGNKSIWE